MHFSKQNDPDPKNLSAEFGFRQEKVWQELEKKMDQPRKRKVIIWLAAACVMAIAAMALWQLMPDEKITLPAVTTVAQKEKRSLSEQTEDPPLNTGVVKSAVVPKKRLAGKPMPTDTRIEPMPEVIREPEVIQQPLEVVITEPANPAPTNRFRIVHVNNQSPSVNASVAGRMRTENSITHTDIIITEINDFQNPVKPKGMFGLLRTNQ